MRSEHLVRMEAPACELECGEAMRQVYRDHDVEAHVTHVAPLVPTLYEQPGLVCPHGVKWYAQPTSEQIARWAREGTA